MSGLRLRLLAPPALRVDLRDLAPATFGMLAPDDAARQPLWHGRERIAVGDLFAVSGLGDPDDSPNSPTLALEGDLRRFDYLGWQMETGTLRVDGHAGDYLGCGLRGGGISVNGDAGDFAGAAQAGGEIDITGNVGDFAAAALPGDMEGMHGGHLRIGGNAGDRLGDRMRRGTVLVAGNAGAFAASRMVAGTLAVGGACGPHLAWAMRRGTVVLATAALPSAVTFVPVDSDIAVFWQLLSRSLARAGGPFSGLPGRRPHRQLGDIAVDGKGELLAVFD